MPQPKFVYDNMQEWVIAKQKAKLAIEEENISPFLKEKRQDYANWLDTVRPSWLEQIK